VSELVIEALATLMTLLCFQVVCFMFWRSTNRPATRLTLTWVSWPSWLFYSLRRSSSRSNSRVNMTLIFHSSPTAWTMSSLVCCTHSHSI